MMDDIDDILWEDEVPFDDTDNHITSEETDHVDIAVTGDNEDKGESVNESPLKKATRIHARFTDSDRGDAIQRHKEDLMTSLMICRRAVSTLSGDDQLLAIVSSVVGFLPNVESMFHSEAGFQSFISAIKSIDIRVASPSGLKRRNQEATTCEPGWFSQSSSDLITCTLAKRFNAYEACQVMLAVLLGSQYRARIVCALKPCSCVPSKHSDIAVRRKRQQLRQIKKSRQEVSQDTSTCDNEFGLHFSLPESRNKKVFSRTAEVVNKANREIVPPVRPNPADVSSDGLVTSPVCINSGGECDSSNDTESDADFDDTVTFVHGQRDQNAFRAAWLEVCVVDWSKQASSHFNPKSAVISLCESDEDSDIEFVGSKSYQNGLDSNYCYKWMQVIPTKRGMEVVERQSNASSNSKFDYTYVVTVEGDGLCKDASWKYVPQLQALMTAGEKRLPWSESSWWDSILSSSRPSLEFVSSTSVIEAKLPVSYLAWDEETGLEFKRIHAANAVVLPTTFAGFKGHPRYTLSRFLGVNQVIHPYLGRPQSYFKGEPVYLVGHVETLKTRFQWKKEFRHVREGEAAFRTVERKRRANGPRRSPGFHVDAATSAMFASFHATGTGTKESSQELASSTFEINLYGSWQTDPLEIRPVIDDILPTNTLGNIEIWDEDARFVPSGAAYISGAQVVRAACRLQIYHVPAIIGFDRSNAANDGIVRPLIGGAVVLERDSEMLREAMATLDDMKQEKFEIARSAAILRKWEDLVRNLLAKQRVKQLFGFA